MTNLSEHLEGFAWQGSNLLVNNPDKIRRIRRKNLSASVAQNVAKCPASMAADTVLPWVSDPFAPNEIGTAGHNVLEEFYQQEPAARTRDFIIAQTIDDSHKVWDITKLGDNNPETLTANEQNRTKWTEIVTQKAIGIFELETPSEVDVYQTELDIRDTPIGPTRVPFRGFIDRVDRIGEDELGVIFEVNDYKLGKWSPPNPRFGDNYGDQMRLYAVAIEEALGRRPAGANLLYPGAGKKRPIDLSEGAIRLTLSDFDRNWKVMNQTADAGVFPAQPGNLCAWCPLANSCPVAKITTEKAINHAKTQPTAVELGIPTIPVQAPYSGPPEDTGVIKTRPAAAAPVTLRPDVDPNLEPTQLVPAPRIGVVETATPNEQDNTMTNTQLQYPTSEYAAMSAFSLTDTATEHIDQCGQMLTPTHIRAFTHVLAGIITRTERRLFGGVGWDHGKHARLGFALASNLKLRPAPFGGDDAAWQGWISTMENFLDAKASIALELLDAEDFDANAYTAFTTNAVQAA